METKRIGAQTLRFSRPPRVESFANIGAKLEGQGPLADYFDELSEDSFFGEKTWEKGEARMQKRVLSRALEKATRRPEELDLIFAGDLLNQCIGTSFALREFGVPLCGVYGACSTMGESLALAAMSIDGGFARRAAAMTSSHFCTAERQYRMPVPYGSQRTRTSPADYDLIVTGDLGRLGHEVVTDLFARDGVDMTKNYKDCGLLLYDLERQDMHMGGSGCGCSAAVLNGYLLRGMREGKWNRIVFAPTGALLSPTSTMQGESIPGVCHAVILENIGEES